ncbi:hypothetical protein ACNFJ7_13095 [Sphingomonas sp. HT-1]|uniref:hypothetical protein n=1 Tax=unclassified Sphingomonas TaxID=196159 RepID=UPI000304B15E|nr:MULTISPECIES: hypothetical protein [unclassified Sphingomonas]KTF69085.1 hypothetical protein ATB93_10500 [Sphingomonas sp. WG]
MRQLSTIELELIVGGYSDSYAYGDSSLVLDGDNAHITVTAADYNGGVAEMQAAGLTIPPITIPIDLGGGFKVSITTPKIKLS